ncbi:MAG: hypothetical protein JWQ07_218 [Ramlibacter sp.]|nr:hypothetical protein [Ramlibacter sp.]
MLLVSAGICRGGRIAKAFGPQADDDADARQTADAAVAVWRAVDSALSPVIGQRGVAALYKRSLHLARADYPWLAAAYDGALQPGDFASLRLALSQQASRAATAAHDALLKTFHDLLSDLIGRSLTQRLLQAVWEPPSSGNAVQDESP